MSKVVDTGEIVCGFGVRKDYEGQKDFDADYIENEVIKVCRKVGPAETDYVLEEKVIEHRKPIREVINSQFEEAGIKAYLKPFIELGEELPGVSVDDKVVDFSKCPEDLAEASKMGDAMMAAYGSLDPELKGGAKSVEEFLQTLSQEKIDAYIQSKIDEKIKKVEVIKDE